MKSRGAGAGIRSQGMLSEAWHLPRQDSAPFPAFPPQLRKALPRLALGLVGEPAACSNPDLRVKIIPQMPAHSLVASASGLLSPAEQGRKLAARRRCPCAGASAGASRSGSCRSSAVTQALLPPSFHFDEQQSVQRSKAIYPVDEQKERCLKPGLHHFTAYPFSTFGAPVQP